jgi:hypothetical protein
LSSEQYSQHLNLMGELGSWVEDYCFVKSQRHEGDRTSSMKEHSRNYAEKSIFGSGGILNESPELLLAGSFKKKRETHHQIKSNGSSNGYPDYTGKTDHTLRAGNKTAIGFNR